MLNIKYTDYTNAIISADIIKNKNLYYSIFNNAIIQNSFSQVNFNGSNFTNTKFQTISGSPVSFHNCNFINSIPGPIYLISDSINEPTLVPIFSYDDIYIYENYYPYNYITDTISTPVQAYYIIGPNLVFTNLTINCLDKTSNTSLTIGLKSLCNIINISNSFFINANISNITFNSCDFSNSDFSGATLTNVIFHNCDLTKCILTNCTIFNCIFTKCTMLGIMSGNLTIDGSFLYIPNSSNPDNSILPYHWSLINGYLVGTGAYLGNSKLNNHV